MTQLILPRKSTVARILRDDATIAHKVAWDVCYSQCIYWCQVAAFAGNGVHDDQAEGTRKSLAHMLGGLNAAEYTGRVARAAVRRVWDDARDCCDPYDVGRFDIADGCPQGVMDVCGAAGLAAASVTGLVEPEDDYAGVIEEWYRDIITREWDGRQRLDPEWKVSGGVARADITGDVIHPRSMIAWMIENEAKWPDPTEFRRRLDSILGDALRGESVR